MTKKARSWSIAIGIVAFPFILFLGFLIFLDSEPLLPIQPLPNPNGYDDFVKAGNMVEQNITDKNYDFEKLNLQELRTLIDENSNALQLARSGLQMQCRVELDYSANSPILLNQLAGIKRLAQAFAAEGKLAELENRPDDAAKSYLDIIHLGNEATRGGVLIDGLVGLAIKEMGTGYLIKLIYRLDANSCRETAANLQTLDSQSQTWDEIMQQENDWSRRTFTGIRYEYVKFTTQKSINATFKKAEKKLAVKEKQTRQLIIDLAARAYALDKGKSPASVSDLVPDYLQAIPQDPSTGANMVYSPR